MIRIPESEARENFGRALDYIGAHGDTVIVERDGKDLAIVMPAAVNENHRK
jgi:PHD/YefM family antitoxin component YafN of YafNO toxin-antitoxin module